MRILVLTDRFLPEISPPCFRTMDHAQQWMKMGHEVTVLTCAPNSPHGKVFSGYRNRLWQTEEMDGVKVIRIWTYMTSNEGIVKRSLDYLSFALMAIFFFWRLPKFDIMVASSPPLFVPVGVYGLSLLRRRPWVFELRDLWPASIAAVGLKMGRVMRLLTKLEMFLYRKADRIVAVTPAFIEELVERGIPREKLDMATNGVNTEIFNEGNVKFDAREKLGIKEGEFLAAYIGATGAAHGLITILDAAELCRDQPDISFVIIGEGADRAKLEKEAGDRNLTNLMFHDFVPHDEIPSYLAALDVGIVHLRPHKVFTTVIPSKIFEFMAMGIPMVYGVEGCSAEIVEEAGAGYCIPSGNARAMVDAILDLQQNPQRLKEMGQCGRDAVAKEFSRAVKAKEMLHSFEKVLGLSSDDIIENPEEK
ncbi:MAG: glycosyltransferase family 4 protein [Pirellulales bacterium]|nr:glycosyltransferase family 4 protein [Pirellulales bacterium]